MTSKEKTIVVLVAAAAAGAYFWKKKQDAEAARAKPGATVVIDLDAIPVVGPNMHGLGELVDMGELPGFDGYGG